MKLVIFDLDGVLARTEHIHTFALKEAIAYFAPEATAASYLEAHDGVRTKDKLARLQHDFQLPTDVMVKIDRRKQIVTEQHLRHLHANPAISECLQLLIANGFTLALASNSRKINVDIVLSALTVDHLFTFKVTGDEVLVPKPNPEIFNKVINHFNVTPSEVYIFEDSTAGKAAAVAAGAKVIAVDANELITLRQINDIIRQQ